MHPYALRSLTFVLTLCVARSSYAQSRSSAPKLDWKAGVATAEITPTESMWMAGYAARKKASEGTAQPLYAKALRLKQEIKAPLVWVAGYSNDDSGYVPSRRVAVEGGYEAANDFTFDVEDRIVGKVHELLKATR